MKPDEDPTPELYLLMDQAGLDATALLSSKKSMSATVSTLRTQLAAKLKSYIVRRDHQMFNQGAHSKETRKIKVKAADDLGAGLPEPNKGQTIKKGL